MKFIDSTNGCGGIHFEIESETISKVLTQFDLENIPDPDIDFQGFGWEDEWYVVADEQKINIPKDMESLKKWICAFFEVYGGYPLVCVDDPAGAPFLTDETRKKIASSIEANIDAIISDMISCKIVSVSVNQYGCEGEVFVYKDGKVATGKATKNDIDGFLCEIGCDDLEIEDETDDNDWIVKLVLGKNSETGEYNVVSVQKNENYKPDNYDEFVEFKKRIDPEDIFEMHDNLRKGLLYMMQREYCYPEVDDGFIEGIFTETPNMEFFKEFCSYVVENANSQYDGSWSASQLFEFFKMSNYKKGDTYYLHPYFGGLSPALAIIPFLATCSTIKDVYMTFTHDKWEARGDYRAENRVGIVFENGRICIDVIDMDEVYDNFSPVYIDELPPCFTVIGGRLASYDESKHDSDLLTIPSSIFSFENGVFEGCHFKNIYFEGSSIDMGIGTFKDCKALETIAYPNGWFVEKNTFNGCENLQSVEFQSDIYGIEKGAFAGCKNLVNINLPETLAFVEEGAFDGCDKLKENNPDVWERLCNLKKSKSEFFDDVERDKQYLLENGMKSIESEDRFYKIIELKKKLEFWHSEFDKYIDTVSILERNKKFSFYSSGCPELRMSKYSELLEEMKIKQTKDFTDFTNILVVDMKNIPYFERIYAKAEAIKRQDFDYVKAVGNSKIEKAVIGKNNGSNVIIITLDNFLELLENRSFAERSEQEIQKERQKQERAEQREREEAEKQLACNIEWIEDKMRLLASRYEGKEKPSTGKQVEEENPDICNKVFRYALDNVPNVKFSDLCLKFGVFSQGHEAAKVEPKAIEYIDDEIDYSGVLYAIGEEPKNIRARIDTLFPKLEGAYPDKVIYGLNRLHDTWGETVTALYRQLGYKSGNDFLRAYGFEVKKESGGRPKKDPNEIINELKRRYPNGVSSIDQIKKENPDIKLQTLMNQSKTLFGTSFSKYLISIGLLKQE